MSQIFESELIEVPGVGFAELRPKRRVCRIIARWKADELSITVPYGLPYSELKKFLDTNRQKLVDLKPKPLYYEGQIIDGCEVDFAIVRQTNPFKPLITLTMLASAPVRGKKVNYAVHLQDSLLRDLHTAPVQQAVARGLLTAARRATEDFIVPLAMSIAAEVGKAPVRWAIKDSKRNLGVCTSKGVISLNPRLVFLPVHLRKYIILHELAHLSHLNHSADFHALLDSYCVGRSAALNSELKAFRFPLP